MRKSVILECVLFLVVSTSGNGEMMATPLRACRTPTARHLFIPPKVFTGTPSAMLWSSERLLGFVNHILPEAGCIHHVLIARGDSPLNQTGNGQTDTAASLTMGITLTGVKKDSATKRARAFNCSRGVSWCHRQGEGERREWHTNSFISEISLSTSSINWMIKSTSLCFSISSVWKFVIKNEMSYP
jgi:hypothetical protein